MSDTEWYYADNGEQHGPVQATELQGLVAAGRLTLEHLVWCDGMDDWQPVGAVAELATLTKPAKPAPRRAEKPVPRKVAAESAEPEPGAETSDAAVSTAKKQPKKVRRPGTDAPPGAAPFEFAVSPPATDEPAIDEPATDEPAAEEAAAEEEPVEDESLADEPPAKPAARRRRPPPSFFPEALAAAYEPPPAVAAAPELGKGALAVQCFAWLCCLLAVLGGIGWFAMRGRVEGESDPAIVLVALIAAALATAHATHRLAEALGRLLK